MAAPDRESSALPVSGLAAAVAILVTALWWQAGPYISSRPAITQQVRVKSDAAQDIDARLWQDPLPAAQRHKDEVDKLRAAKEAESAGGRLADETVRHGVEAFSRTVLARKKTALVAVMVAGGPYAEHAEQRRRVRYAILSGLNASGFFPEDEEHIGYVELSPPVSKGGTRLEIVPFEMFTADSRYEKGADGNPYRVVVLWLDESAFRRGPIGELDTLFRQLLDSPHSSCEASPVSAGATAEGQWPRRVLLGPVSSTALAAMVDDLEASAGGLHVGLNGLAVYSPTATAPPEQIFRSDRRGQTWIERDIVERFRREGMMFVRMRPTDDRLMGALLKELRARGLEVDGKSSHHIAVVSEWDTLYGRALPEALETALCQGARTCPSLHRFSYMRGLDGLLPAPPAADPEKAAREDGKKDRPDSAQMERPEGNGQYDYVRRLALHIRQMDQALQHEPGGGRIRAVGVLGSDPYDKQIVMQAVRRELPAALLFTTDLDARFLDPREATWSRNLIVASGFGLQLTRGLQGDIPPFRDSDQTATYLTTMVALQVALDHRGGGGEIVREVSERWKRAPRLFEVGRTRAYDLSEAGDDPGCTRERLFDCTGIHPERHTFLRSASPSLRWALPVVAGAAAGLALLSASRVPRTIGGLARRGWRWRRKHRRLAAALIIGSVIAAAAAGGMIAAAARDPDGEPFALLEGISVWPTQALRGLAVLITIFALIQICANRLVSVRLPREFLLPGARWCTRARWRDLASWGNVRRIFAAGPPRVAPWSKVRATDIWDEYVYQSSIPGRAARVGVSGGLFFLFGGLIIRRIFTPPDSPVRGVWSAWVDIVLLWLSVLAFIILIFAVIDAIRLCYRAARGLARDAQTTWPPITRQRFIRQLQVPSPADDAFFSPWIESWIDVQFIARWTTAIASLVYYPFAVLGLLLVARSPIFDDWDLTPGLLIIFALSGGYAVAAAYLLRRTAEHTRSLALRDIDAAQRGAAGAPIWQQTLLKLVREDIESLREGAFVPFTQQPVIKAVLVPLASVLSTLVPLEYLLRFW